MSCRRDHPRVCGEKPSASLITSVVAGSPPRMRGKVWLVYLHPGSSRITPAYAGKSSGWPICCALSRDHPRVCGEKQTAMEVTEKQVGSPPRMRGKVLPIAFAPAPTRITPAYAGKRGFVLHNQRSCKDHPRVCGEKKANLQNTAQWIGSPPRMRGKDHTEISGDG